MHGKIKKTDFFLFIVLFNLMIIPFGNYADLKPEKTDFERENLGISVNLNWTRIIDENNGDEGRAIATDSEDNIYIVGKVYNDSSSSFDLLLVKYNSTGDQQWNVSWGGSQDDYANGIAINGSKDIYVVGSTQSYGNGSYDACLLKFNSSGARKWNITWGGVDWDEGNGITLNDLGKVYMVGYSESVEVNGDMVLVKFDSKGKMEWNISWGGADNDYGNGLAIDSSDNIYATGYTASYGPPGTNLMLVKYNSSGDLKWNETWGGVLPDLGSNIKLISDNDIFLLGSTESQGAGTYDVLLLKYNNTGDLQWSTTWGGLLADWGNNLDVDTHNNIFIVGNTESFGDLDGDICIVKFNSTGSEVWNKTWGRTLADRGFGIALDSEDTLYITGRTDSFGDITGDILLQRYLPIPDNFTLDSNADSPDADGNFTLLWTRSLDANNYTVYMHDSPITKITGAEIPLISETKNWNLYLTDYAEDIYYFAVVAINDYGTTLSNCISVYVNYIPGTFKLSHNASTPDPEGNFKINWSDSIGEDNYSVYTHDSFIREIENNGTLIDEGLDNYSYIFSDYLTGDYYFVIVAYNDAGKNMSNCILVSVGRYPLPFNLTLEAENPDKDGNFNLTWTYSNFSTSYEFYYSSRYITEINSTVDHNKTLTPGFIPPDLKYKILETDWETGTYYIVFGAKNIHNETLSNCVKLEVERPKDKDDNEPPQKDSLKPFNFTPLVLFGIMLAGIVIAGIIKKKNKYTFSR